MSSPLETICQADRSQYFKTIEQIFTQTPIDQISIALNDLYSCEMKLEAFLDKANQEVYRKLYTQFRDRVFLEFAGSGQFNFDLLKVVSLVLRSGTAPKPHSSYKNFRFQFSQALQGSPEGIGRLVMCCYLLVWDVLNGSLEQGPRDFIQNIFESNPEQFLKNSDVNGVFRSSFKLLFPELGAVLRTLKESVFAKSYFARAIDTQKSAVIWVLAFLWTDYSEQEMISRELYDVWKALFLHALKRNDSELACFLYTPLFHIALAVSENQQAMKKFNDDIELPLSEYFCDLARSMSPTDKTLATREPKTPKRVGFLVSAVKFNSPTKILISLLTHIHEHLESEYEIYLFDYQRIETSQTAPELVQKLTSLNVHYCPLGKKFHADGNFRYSTFEKCRQARQQIIENQIDILFVESGIVASNFLFATRTAPVQLYWSHGNPFTDFQGIDHRIIHSQVYGNNNLEMIGSHLFYKFIPGMLKEFYTPNLMPQKLEKARNQFPKSTVIYGNIGRIKKMANPEFIATLCRILKAVPQAIFISCGGGNDEANYFYKAMLTQLQEAGVRDRCYFMGDVDAHVYGSIIDVFLNSFPEHGGESISEYAAKGGLVLSLCSEAARLDRNPEQNTDVLPTLLLRRNLSKVRNRLMAHSTQDYVQLAVNLAEDYVLQKKDRNEIREYEQRYRYLHDVYMNGEMSARSFHAIMQECWALHDPTPVREQYLKQIEPHKIDWSKAIMQVEQAFLKHGVTKQSRIHVMGLGFTPNENFGDPMTHDLPSFVLYLQNEGYQVSVADPHLSLVQQKQQLSGLKEIRDVDSRDEILIVTTPLPELYAEMFARLNLLQDLKGCKLILDINASWSRYAEEFKESGIVHVEILP